MNILIGSHHFFPSTGGIETVTNLLGREFARRAHQVRVVTQTPGGGDFPFVVVRRPGTLELLGHVRWADVFLQNNISLRTLWPLLFVRRPLFVTHQTWITNADGSTAWQHGLKRFALGSATSFAISEAIAGRLPVPSIRVGNPYDDEVFKEAPGAERDRELIFVGRLVSDKGVSILLDALGMVDRRPLLTIVGEGPERPGLERKATELGLQDQVEFVGAQRGDRLAELLRRHEILVVPSLWQEPFGIVALEGIACGCVVVGSAGGGLAEAIGPCGLTFPNGDAAALARTITQVLADPDERARLRQAAPAHLARFTPSHVAGLYLEAMEKTRR